MWGDGWWLGNEVIAFPMDSVTAHDPNGFGIDVEIRVRFNGTDTGSGAKVPPGEFSNWELGFWATKSVLLLKESTDWPFRGHELQAATSHLLTRLVEVKEELHSVMDHMEGSMLDVGGDSAHSKLIQDILTVRHNYTKLLRKGFTFTQALRTRIAELTSPDRRLLELLERGSQFLLTGQKRDDKLIRGTASYL